MRHWESLVALAECIHQCRRCPRLVAHREAVAAVPPRRYRGQTYWARPLSGFGDPDAWLAVVGLAPAAHGGNRTGRFFTGDESGRFLFRAMHEVGLASRPTSESLNDGLRLLGAFVTAVVRCPPPSNRPSPQETANCLPYLSQELELLRRLRAIVALGAFAWRGAVTALRDLGESIPSPLPPFAHGTQVEIRPGLSLLGSYHPSQQNTFTGRLTPPMLRGVLQRAIQIAKSP